MMRFLGLGPGPWVPGPLGLVIAMEIFHDEIFGFGPGSLGPRPSRVPHRHGIFRDEIFRVWAQVPGSQAL